MVHFANSTSCKYLFSPATLSESFCHSDICEQQVLGGPCNPAKICNVTTPMGNMVAIADDTYLYLLLFEKSDSFYDVFLNLRQSPEARICVSEGKNPILEQLQKEISLYFKGKLKEFTIPYKLFGSLTQNTVWSALTKVSYGKTCSYKDIAIAINNPQGSRAVGGANNKNPICIIIPCHRVLASNGKLTGYAGGLTVKEKLLNLEQKYS